METTNPVPGLDCAVYAGGYFVYELAVLAQLIVSKYHSNLTVDWQVLHPVAVRSHFERAENFLRSL